MNRALISGIFIGGAAAAALLGGAARLQASGQGGASAAAGRVASINVVRVFNEYQRQKDLTEELRTRKDELQTENQKKRERIDALERAMQLMSPTDPTYSTKMEEVLKEQFAFKNWYDMVEAATAREVGLWTARIYREILDAVQEVAESEGVELVLYFEEFRPPANLDPDAVRQMIQTRQVIHASPTSDLSQTVLDRLNAKYRQQPRTPMLRIAAP